MNNFATYSDFKAMTLEQIENTLNKYIVIGQNADWDVSADFIKDLEMLTFLAREKGSKQSW